jgi:MFS family permease
VPLGPLVLATVFAHCAFSGSRLAISLFALDQGASALVVGVLMSLFSALPMLVGVSAGRMVDRVGIRHPILWSGSVLFASVATAGFFPFLATLFAVSAVIGTSFMLFHICVQHAVGEMKGDRIANFGWLALGFSISNFIAPTFPGSRSTPSGMRMRSGSSRSSRSCRSRSSRACALASRTMPAAPPPTRRAAPVTCSSTRSCAASS